MSKKTKRAQGDTAKPAPRDTGRKLRWAGALVVLVLSLLAALGNAPASEHFVVRRSSTGAAPPGVDAKTRGYIRLRLPPGRAYSALQIWSLKAPGPVATVVARDPRRRPLPETIHLPPRRRRLPPQDFAVKEHRSRRMVGWFAVRLWDGRGRESVLFFEKAIKIPGYMFRCSSVSRDEKARKLSIKETKKRFTAKFARFPGPPSAGPAPMQRGAPYRGERGERGESGAPEGTGGHHHPTSAPPGKKRAPGHAPPPKTHIPPPAPGASSGGSGGAPPSAAPPAGK